MHDFPIDFFSQDGQMIYHLLFLAIPKNASTSIISHLGNYNILQKYNNQLKESCDSSIYRHWFNHMHARPREVYRAMGSCCLNYKSFCVVRNPWDRVVSMFKYAKQENLSSLFGIDNDFSFGDFCEELWINKSNEYFIGSFNQMDWVDGCLSPVVLRFENLQKDFAAFLKDCGVHHISADLPHENATNKTLYREFYCEKTKKQIAEVFERDIKMLKYSF